MCELFAINALRPVKANDHLRLFYQDSVEHPHGWGLSWRENENVYLYKEELRAIDSEYLDRLLDARKQVAAGAISGAVGTYSSIDPFIESYVCEHLGLEGDPLSTQVISRDHHAYLAGVLATTAATCERIATEIRNLQRTDTLEVEEPFRKYVPFMVSVYEGGMMAYPLYTFLCGMENLSRIALLDIAGLIFGFSIYMSLLSFTESGDKPSAGKLAKDALTSPPFIAAVLGIAAGVTGVMRTFLSTGAGEVYLAAEQMLTAPLSGIILIVVGYSIQMEKGMAGPCVKTVLLRAALQAVMIIGTLWAMRTFAGTDRLTETAAVIYMSAPATFSMQSFVKDARGGHYVSTANALYCFVSIDVFAAVAVFFAPVE